MNPNCGKCFELDYCKCIKSASCLVVKKIIEDSSATFEDIVTSIEESELYFGLDENYIANRTRQEI